MRIWRLISSAILATLVIIEAQTLGILNHPIGISITGALVSAVLASALLYGNLVKGDSIPYFMAYLSSSILLVLGYSITTFQAPQPTIASEYLLTTAFLALLTGVWDIIKEMSSRELIPQLIFLATFILSLRGADLRIVTGAMALTIPFITSKKSFVGLLISYVFIPLPIIGLLTTVTEIGNVPRFTFASIPVTSPLYSVIMIVFYVTWIISALISGGVMILLSNHIEEIQTLKSSVKHVVLSLLPTYLFLMGFVTTEFILFRSRVEALFYTYLGPFILSTALTVSTLTLQDSVLYLKRKSTLKAEITKLLESIKGKADLIVKVLKTFEEVGLMDNELREIEAKTRAILSDLSKVEKEAKRRLSYNALLLHLTSLRKNDAYLNHAESTITKKFDEAVKLLRKALPYMKIYDESESVFTSKEIDLMAHITSTFEIPARLKALNKISWKICESLSSSLNVWFRELRAFLGVSFLDSELKCEGKESPFREISELLALSKRVSDVVNPKISEAYKKLVALKREIGDLQLMSHDVLRERSFTYSALNSLYEGLRNTQETLPSPYTATLILNKKANFLREETPKVLNALLKDVERVRAELGMYEIKWVTNILDLLAEVEKSLNKLIINAYNTLNQIKDVPTTYEVIELLYASFPEILREGVNLVTDAVLVEVRASLIPMVFDYFDWKIRTAREEGVPINDLPFTKEALLWFLRLYVTSRKNVTVRRGYLVREVV